MEQALIGLVGLLIGILLNEYFRRKNRIEGYAQKIFEKRLEIYEGLFALLQEGFEISSNVIDDSSLSYDERHKLISSVVMSLA